MILLPIEPPSHELPVVQLVLDEIVGDREEDRRLRPGIRWYPVVGVRGGVRESCVEHDELGAVLAAFDDPLRVRIEVVPGLEVRRYQHDHVGVGVVGARAVMPIQNW